MKARKITNQIYALHADITQAPYFEGFWPIPFGVSLNSYLVSGNKTAIIDLYADWENATRQMTESMSSVGFSPESIDYLILNHLEPDHTSYIQEFLKRNPSIHVFTSAKGIDLLENFCKPEKLDAANMHCVKNGDILDLGNNTMLQFIETPNVHWPETMMTFEQHSGCLFSCDAFGSFGSIGERIFDDELSESEHLFFEKESLRYYANIMSSVSAFVKNAVEKISSLSIQYICPSHGIIWHENPQKIINRYLKYADYASGDAHEKEICVIYGSMYGNTKEGVKAVINGINAENISCTVHEVPGSDLSSIIGDAFKAGGLLIAMPTYENGMYPPAADVLNLFLRKRITEKTVLRIGSMGWCGGAQNEYDTLAQTLHWKNIESYEWQGKPTESDLLILKEKGRQLAKIIQKLPNGSF